MDTRFELIVPAGQARKRLEDHLLQAFPTVSKMYLRELVRDERCEVNGRSENIGFRVRPGDLIEIWLDEARGTAMIAEKIALDVVYEDTDIIVINKPAGMLVHPSHREKRGTLLNALVHHMNKGDRLHIRPGLIHRLDKETSGLIVAAKNANAHRVLSRHFMKKLVRKGYVALVDGILAEQNGTITAPIGRFAEGKHWCVRKDGKHAETKFAVEERNADTTILSLEPITGRTNQLRIHCESIGHPIVGDTRRGGRVADRLYLHAAKLAFAHPVTKEELSFTAEANFPPLTGYGL